MHNIAMIVLWGVYSFKLIGLGCTMNTKEYWVFMGLTFAIMIMAQG